MNRKTARENAFLLLCDAGSDPAKTPDEILDDAITLELEVDNYVREIVFGTYEHREEIAAVSGECLLGWKRERISPVSRAIITLATYELKFIPDIPTKVSINEGIELAKKYDDEKTYAFVNGVLNAVAKAVRP